METIMLGEKKIEFELNEVEEGEIWEDFDMNTKISYATIGAVEVLRDAEVIPDFPEEVGEQLVIGLIFQKLMQDAKGKKLDYLQHISIEGKKLWCIDNGETICLLTPDEY